MEFSAGEWQLIWRQLNDAGEINLAGRISHDVGHIWNSEDWDRRVTLDMSSEDADRVKQAARQAGIGI